MTELSKRSGIDGKYSEGSLLRKRIVELEQRVKHWQTWYYNAEESLCSCHLPDNIVCSWHKQNPGAPDAEVFALADKVESLEQKLGDLRALTESVAKHIERWYPNQAADLRAANERNL